MTEMNNVVSPASARVLIVDDEETQRNGLASMVSSWGFAAETACDGQDALEKLNNGTVQVLVTDLMMPRMDGFEVLAQLRSEPEYSQLPVIVVTAKELESHETAWLLERSQSCISKHHITGAQFAEYIEHFARPRPVEVSTP